MKERRFFLENKRLLEIVEKANKLAQKVSSKDDEIYVNLDKIVDYLEEDKNCEINITTIDIKNFAISVDNKDLLNADGFIFSNLPNKGNKKKYFIGVNETNSNRFKRFALAHELGHLYLGHQDYDNMNGFKVSAHIAYSLSTEDGNNEEQEANAFALALLMPTSSFTVSYKYFDSIRKLSFIYRVSEEAVMERIKILSNLGV